MEWAVAVDGRQRRFMDDILKVLLRTDFCQTKRLRQQGCGMVLLGNSLADETGRLNLHHVTNSRSSE